MTSPDLTPNDVRNVAFSKPPIGSRGYDEAQVDAFLDRAEQVLAAGLPLAELVRAARFTKPPMGKRGYDVQQVDDFLDRVAGAGGRGPVAPAPPAPGTSAAVTESPFVQERPGVLARLFGRR